MDDPENAQYAPLPPITLSPYERLRMQGVGPGLGATTGPEAPETVLPMFASLAEPAIKLPRLNPEGTVGKILAAPVNLAESAIEGITSPIGAATIPLFGSAGGRVAMGLLGTAGGVQRMAQSQDAGEFTQGALQTAISPFLFRGVRMPQAEAPGPVAPEAIRARFRNRVEQLRDQHTIQEGNRILGEDVVQRLQAQTRARSNKAYAAGQKGGDNPYVDGTLEAQAFDLGKKSLSQTEGEVIRITPQGRRAVFDAKTKKFLRYAD